MELEPPASTCCATLADLAASEIVLWEAPAMKEALAVTEPGVCARCSTRPAVRTCTVLTGLTGAGPVCATCETEVHETVRAVLTPAPMGATT